MDKAKQRFLGFLGQALISRGKTSMVLDGEIFSFFCFSISVLTLGLIFFLCWESSHYAPPGLLWPYFWMVAPEILWLVFFYGFFYLSLFLSPGKPAPLFGDDLDEVYTRSPYLGFWPHWYPAWPLFLLLWGIPIFLASRSFYIRVNYLPPSWDPWDWGLALSSWVQGFPLSLWLGLGVSLAPIFYQFRIQVRAFTSGTLKFSYYWLLVRLWASPGAPMLRTLILFRGYYHQWLRWVGRRCPNFIFTLFLYPFNPQWAWKPWLLFLALDLCYHQGILVWTLAGLPYWAWLLLIWRSWSFLMFYHGSTRDWYDLFYKPPGDWTSETRAGLQLYFLFGLMPPQLRGRSLALLRWRKISLEGVNDGRKHG